VALDTRTRSSIYHKLTPILGEDDANALMSEFPGSEGDELVTKSFLRAELSELRAEMAGIRAELTSDMSDLRADMAGIRAELTSDMSDLRAEMAGLRAGMSSLETRLTLRMGAMGVVILSAMFGLKLFA
jgi:hypothetical protein